MPREKRKGLGRPRKPGRPKGSKNKKSANSKSKKRVIVTKESKTKRNLRFRDNKTNKSMSRDQFNKAIRAGKYPKHHLRKINGVWTPVSNPDRSKSNNLD